MNSMKAVSHWVINAVFFIIAVGMLSGCATSTGQIREWEKSGNVTKLSEVARDKSESSMIRKSSLESLARLNWKPSNDERLQVYSMFASKSKYQEASALMQALNAEAFAEIDEKIVIASALLTLSGTWTQASTARVKYDELCTLNKKAVTISLCQQVVARPLLKTRILLLAIKLGIEGSENELVGVLFEYGDKSMAEDYLNSGSGTLAEGGRRWANAHGYRVSTGYGSHRSGWGKF